eukprot:403332863
MPENLQIQELQDIKHQSDFPVQEQNSQKQRSLKQRFHQPSQNLLGKRFHSNQNTYEKIESFEYRKEFSTAVLNTDVEFNVLEGIFQPSPLRRNYKRTIPDSNCGLQTQFYNHCYNNCEDMSMNKRQQKAQRKSHYQLQSLEQFFKSYSFPWPQKDLERLAGQTGLTVNQVYKWGWDQRNKLYKRLKMQHQQSTHSTLNKSQSNAHFSQNTDSPLENFNSSEIIDNSFERPCQSLHNIRQYDAQTSKDISSQRYNTDQPNNLSATSILSHNDQIKLLMRMSTDEFGGYSKPNWIKNSFSEFIKLNQAKQSSTINTQKQGCQQNQSSTVKDITQNIIDSQDDDSLCKLVGIDIDQKLQELIEKIKQEEALEIERSSFNLINFPQGSYSKQEGLFTEQQQPSYFQHKFDMKNQDQKFIFSNVNSNSNTNESNFRCLFNSDAIQFSNKGKLAFPTQNSPSLESEIFCNSDQLSTAPNTSKNVTPVIDFSIEEDQAQSERQLQKITPIKTSIFSKPIPVFLSSGFQQKSQLQSSQKKEVMKIPMSKLQNFTQKSFRKDVNCYEQLFNKHAQLDQDIDKLGDLFRQGLTLYRQKLALKLSNLKLIGNSQSTLDIENVLKNINQSSYLTQEKSNDQSFDQIIDIHSQDQSFSKNQFVQFLHQYMANECLQNQDKQINK